MQQQSAFGDLNDAFGGLNFGTTTNTAPGFGPITSPAPLMQQAAPKPSPFADLTAGLKKPSGAVPQLTGSSGGFFSSIPAAAPKPATSTSSTSGFGDLFDLSGPTQRAAPAASTMASSAFNLTSSQPIKPVTNSSGFSFDSDPWASAAPVASAPAPAPTTAAASSNDIWGGQSSNAWSTPAPAAPPKPAPTVKDDDDWGNFSSSTTAAPTASGTGGFDDDLFGNVWK